MESNDEIARITRENEHLERRLEELRFALNAHSIIAVTDKRGVILDVNDRFCEVSKYSKAELIGQTHRLINSGYHPSEFFKEMWRVIGRGNVWRNEVCNRAKDGTEYWVDTTIVPLLDERGKPKRYVAIRTEETQRRQAEAKVRQLAFTDAVTGLPNAVALTETITKATSACAATTDTRHVALLSLGIEDYSTVANAFGLPAGETMLRAVAALLSRKPFEGVTVARTGDDTFGLFFANAGENAEEARRICELTAEIATNALDTAMEVGGGVTVRLTTSIGYAVWQADELSSPGELLACAEIARTSIAKSDSPTKIAAYMPTQLTEAQDRIAFAADLLTGLKNDAFRLHFQPLVDRAKRLVGYEALLRWQDPERGLVAPDAFIPVAEQTGIIIEIGYWVIEQAARLLGSWRLKPETQHLRIAINISARQLAHEPFVDTVAQTLKKFGAPADRLTLEVTESIMLTGADAMIEKLHNLNALGLRTSLDDFGTGYSSLSYLQRMPVHEVKIDRSFVQSVAGSPESEAIVRAIVKMCQVLKLEIVAEGIEEPEQFDALSEMGADVYQGWMFGRPKPIDA